MKTIEEIAKDILKLNYSDFDKNERYYKSELEMLLQMSKFVQRWIPVKEEELPLDKPFLSKSSNNDEFISLCAWNKSLNKFNPIINGIHESTLRIENITHWRPIELK